MYDDEWDCQKTELSNLNKRNKSPLQKGLIDHYQADLPNLDKMTLTR